MRCVHHDDRDGLSAAAVVARFTQDYDPDHYIQADYDKFQMSNDMFPEGDTIYVVDYGFNDNTIQFLKNALRKKCHVIWIDHHETAEKFVKENEDLEYEMNLDMYIHQGRSGALLAWEYLFKNDDAPFFIRLISDYDCWQKKYEESDFFELGLCARDTSPTSRVWLGLFSPGGDVLMEEIIKEGKIIWKYQEATNTMFRATQGYESTIKGVRCYVMNRDGNSFIFGEKYQEYPCVVLWYYNGSEYNYSIYSDKKVIVNTIAEQYDGGGHPYAAGFKTKELILHEKK